VCWSHWYLLLLLINELVALTRSLEQPEARSISGAAPAQHPGCSTQCSLSQTLHDQTQHLQHIFRNCIP